MKKMVYADNAATTQLDPDAFEAMRAFLLNEYGNPSQPYSFSRSAKRALEDARATIAECIGAKADEIFFTSGGTESDNWAIKCGSGSGGVLTSEIEHHAILYSCSAYAKTGKKVVYVSPTSDGIITPEAVNIGISKEIGLVSIMTANNEIGTIQPIVHISEICKKKGILFHTDAVQAVGHIPLNVKELGVDLLSASAHKFHGPKGIGFLYIKRGTPVISFMDGGSQESGLRAGTHNVPAIVGMAVALKKGCSHLSERIVHIKRIEQRLLDGLTGNGIHFFRNGGANTLPGLISLSFAGYDGEAILHRLDLKGIAISTGSACNSQSTEISHVLKAIQLCEQLAHGTIRISLGDRNSEEDIDAIVDALCQIVRK